MEDQAITLLLVEGHPGVRDALATRLRRASGIGTVHVAPNLQAGTLMVEEHAPQLVLVDPRSVGVDPVAVVQRLTGEHRRVVVFTSSLLQEEEAALLRVGCAAIAYKGVEFAALLRLIKSLFVQ